MLEGGGSQSILGDSSRGSLLSSTPNSAFLSSKPQPFCHDPEGWGPLSQFRFDLTPCFLDFGVSLVAVWGIIAGAGALWLLFKKRVPQPVSKNWHFYAKLVRKSPRPVLMISSQSNHFRIIRPSCPP